MAVLFSRACCPAQRDACQVMEWSADTALKIGRFAPHGKVCLRKTAAAAHVSDPCNGAQGTRHLQDCRVRGPRTRSTTTLSQMQFTIRSVTMDLWNALSDPSRRDDEDGSPRGDIGYIRKGGKGLHDGFSRQTPFHQAERREGSDCGTGEDRPSGGSGPGLLRPRCMTRMPAL